MRIKRVREMFDNVYDYSNIINTMKKSYGWGFGVLNFLDDFESNSEYFKSPKNDEEYASEFHCYLKDLTTNRLRGEFQNTQTLRLGNLQSDIQVNRPESIYNKYY